MIVRLKTKSVAFHFHGTTLTCYEHLPCSPSPWPCQHWPSPPPSPQPQPPYPPHPQPSLCHSPFQTFSCQPTQSLTAHHPSTSKSLFCCTSLHHHSSQPSLPHHHQTPLSVPHHHTLPPQSPIHKLPCHPSPSSPAHKHLLHHPSSPHLLTNIHAHEALYIHVHVHHHHQGVKTVLVAQCSWLLLIMWRMGALGHFPLLFSLLVHPCHIIIVINEHVVFWPFSTLSELVMWHLINYIIINRYRSGWLPSATRATWTTWTTWATQATWATRAMLTIPAVSPYCRWPVVLGSSSSTM